MRGGLTVLVLAIALALAAPVGAATVSYSGSTLVVTGSDPPAAAGRDQIHIFEEFGQIVVTEGTSDDTRCARHPLGVRCARGSVEGISVALGEGRDRLGYSVDLPVTATGGPGDDFINGPLDLPGDPVTPAGPMTVDGGEGTDSILGTGRLDELAGGPDDDFLTASPGQPDEFSGGDGTDRVSYFRFFTPVTAKIGSGGVGADIEDLAGSSAGGDRLTGDGGPNKLFGGHSEADAQSAIPDILEAGGGDDRLSSNFGDEMRGGAGDDFIEISPFPAGAASAPIDGGPDGPQGDSLSFEFLDGGVSVSLNGVADDGRPGDSVNVTDVEHVTGTRGDDQLTGDAKQNVLVGGNGEDRLSGGGDDDTLRGGTEFDKLAGGLGDDVLDGGVTPGGGEDDDEVSFAASGAPVVANLATGVAVGEGTDALTEVEGLEGSPQGDVLRGDARANALSGGDGDDELEGGANGDLMSGGAGDDELDGEDGEDIFFGGPGADDLDGGADADVAAGNDGDDLVAGGAGDDQLLGADGNDTLSFALVSVPVSVDLAAGTATGEGTDQVQTIENVIGGSHNDTLVGNAEANVLDGRVGDDTLRSSGDAAVDDDRCGDGTDSVEADPADLVAADCEAINQPPGAPPPAAPPSSGSPPPPPTSTPTGTPSPGIPTGPGTLVTVSIAGGTYTVSQNGTVSLPVACPASSGGCQGFVQLLTASKVPVVVSRTRRRVVRLGRARFTLDAGERRRVRIRLSRRNQRLLRRLGRVRVKARAVVRDSAGNTQTSTRTVILKTRRPGR